MLHIHNIKASLSYTEQELQELLPGVDVVRMDTDTVSPAHSHEALLSRFRAMPIWSRAYSARSLSWLRLRSK